MGDTKAIKATIQEKKVFELPKGAKIIKKDVNTSIEEIENGFLIRKSYDLKWTSADGENSNYEYFTKTWYTEKNPITYTEDEEIALADKL